MRQPKFFWKIFSLLNSASLILQTLLPVVSLAPASVFASGTPSANISWDGAKHEFSFSVTTAEKVDYVLSYQTPTQTEGVKDSGQDLSGTYSKDKIYAGTCSSNGTCVPHEVLRGILKTKIASQSWIYTKIFNVDNGQLSVIKEGNDSQLELTPEETEWLGNPTNGNLNKVTLSSGNSEQSPPSGKNASTFQVQNPTSGWPSCGFQCKAEDTYVTEFKLVKPGTDELVSATCTPDTLVSAEIVGSFYNNSGSARKAVVILGDIVQGGQTIKHFSTGAYDGQCVTDTLPGQTTTKIPIYSFSWKCGQPLVISNLNVSWGTGGDTCAAFFASPACSERTTKCYSSPNFEVTAPLMADFTTGDACVQSSVNFSAAASGGTPSYTYNWNYNDGATGTGQNTTHAYSVAGAYNPSLTVNDSASNTYSKSHSINIWNKPVVAFSSSTQSCPSSQINFHNTSVPGSINGGAISGYSWDFGDGSSSTESDPSHTFASPGTYTVRLTANDSHSCSNFVEHLVTINPCSGGLTVTKVFTDNHSPANVTINLSPLGLYATTGTTDSTGHITFSGLPAGKYSAVAVEPQGYYESGNTCADINVTAGQTATCTITDSPIKGIITVHKDIQGGTATPSQFCFTLHPDPNNVGAVCADNTTANAIFNNLPYGTYSVTENSVTGYGPIGSNCSSLSIVNNGDSKSCTFVNVRSSGVIRAQKVVNDGSDLTAWSFAIDNNVPINANSQGIVNFGSYYTLENHSITEYGPGGYHLISVTGTNCTANFGAPSATVTAASGQTVTCTFTNIRDIGSYGVRKLTDTNGDGTYETTDAGSNALGFRWGLNSANPTNTFGPIFGSYPSGTYTINENTVAGYHFSGWYNTHGSGSCTNPDGTTLPVTIEIKRDQETDITFCNARDTGTINVVKKINPTTDSGKFNLLIDGVSYKNDAVNNNSTGAITVITGQHVISETSGTGSNVSYYNTSITCTGTEPTAYVTLNGQTLTIPVNKGNTVTCTITNTRAPGGIRVDKFVDTDGNGTFDGDNTIANNLGFSWSVDGNQIPGNSFGSTVDYAPGDHQVTENILPGYHLAGWYYSGWVGKSCDNPSSYNGTTLPINVTVQSKTLSADITLCNARDTGTITVVKSVSPADSSRWDFVVDGPSHFVTTLGNGNSTGAHTSIVGNYTISETAHSGTVADNYTSAYTCSAPTGLVASGTGTSATFKLSINQNVTCTFTNSIKRGTINVLKHTFPAGAPDSFAFTLNTPAGINNFSLKDNEGQTFANLLPGNYSISETIPSDWRWLEAECNGNAYARGDQITLSPGQTISCSVTNARYATLTAHQFTDTNINGVEDATEGPNSSGWWMHLYQNPDCTGTQLAQGSTTLPSGNYVFGNLTPGEYSIREDLLNVVWAHSTAACQNIVLSYGDNGQLDFGNFVLGSISGKKYEDINGNGSWDTEEPGLSGWTVFIDANNNQNFDAGETSTTTDADGDYYFSDAFPKGDYTLCEVQKIGWTQTQPNTTNQCYSISIVRSGQNETGRYFGNFALGSISGKKYWDQNGNGTEDFNEPPLADWVIYLDADNNSQLDNGELYTSTDVQGGYHFDNLGPGLYHVREVAQTGWIVFQPSSGVYDLALKSGAALSSVNFGNSGNSSIKIIKTANPWSSQLFGFTAKGTGLSDFSLDDDGDNTNAHANSVQFNNLVPGTYTLTEEALAGWDLDSISCEGASYSQTGNTLSLLIGGGEDITCTFANTKRGKVEVFKYSDNNNNGQFDDESLLRGWEMILTDGDIVSFKENTNTSGEAVFNNVFPGAYYLSETPQTGWNQTGVSCNNDSRNELRLFQTVGSLTHYLSVAAGETVICYVGNFPVNPLLILAKSNDASGDKNPGDSVTFTLELSTSQSGVGELHVTDLMAGGFQYRSGSWKVYKNGIQIFTVPEPQYHSPATWDLSSLGTLNPEETIKLTYVADIDGGQPAGKYKDLAWAQGLSLAEASVLANADTGIFVGTDVNIVRSGQSTTSTNIETGQVLGASTLPATGNSPIWIIIAMLMFISGLIAILIGVKPGIVKQLLAFAVVVFIFLFSGENSYAANLSIRLSEPKTPTTSHSYDINFVALDLLNRPIIVKCIYKKEGDTYHQFGNDISLSAGGNSGNCHVGSDLITSNDTTYYFYVTASADAEQAASPIVSVSYDLTSPGTPTNYLREQTGSCQYKISFKTADDGQTVKVEIYRSTSTSFSVDNSSRVGQVSLGPNTTGNYTDNVPDCGAKYYYVIRAFDSAGNGSNVIGDSVVTVTTSTTSQPGTGAIPVSSSLSQVLGTETATSDGIVLGADAPAVEVVDMQSPDTVSKTAKNLWWIIPLGLIFVLAGFFFYRRQRN